jgi:hypothetical protein
VRGHAAALHGQWPPDVNVTAPPGSWPGHDILFDPSELANGVAVRHARVIVLLEGAQAQGGSRRSRPAATRAERGRPRLMPRILKVYNLTTTCACGDALRGRPGRIGQARQGPRIAP